MKKDKGQFKSLLMMDLNVHVDLSLNRIYFTVLLQNRLISARLEPVLSHTQKSYIVSYYSQFSTNSKMKNQNINVIVWAFGPSGLIKPELTYNLSFYYSRKAVFNMMR